VVGVGDDSLAPFLKGIARHLVVSAESVDLIFVLFHEGRDEVGVRNDKCLESVLWVSHEGSNLLGVVVLDVLNEVGEGLAEVLNGYLVLVIDLGGI